MGSTVPVENYEDIVLLIRQNLNCKSIAKRIGMNELATRRLVVSLVDRHKIDYSGTVNDDTPYGMDTESLAQRIKLGSLLYDLRESLNGDRTKVSRLTGLNRNEQIKAEQRPFEHEWTISQMQRLAKAISVNYKDII